MKKSSAVLWMLSVCGVITTFAFVAANTIRTNNARQSVVSTSGFEYPQVLSQEENIKDTTEVVKGVTVATPVLPPVEEEEVVEEDVVPVEVEQEGYIMPVVGEIVQDFTDTVLVFQETYGDYRTHLGIDIEAPENTPVLCVSDGIVTKSEMDYEQGYVVSIEHNDGKVSVYKNLSTNKMAPVGKVFFKGETIGAVGNSGIFESHMEPHLHFELYEDNVEVDPKDYFD